MSEAKSDLPLRARTGVLLVVAMLAAMLAGPWAYAGFLFLIWMVGAREATQLLRKGMAGPVALMAVAGAGIWALAVLGLAGIAWSQGAYSPWMPLGWFILIWLNDTGAYFAGRSLGRHKLAPAISPGKTWEGWAGGLLASMGAALLLAAWMPAEAPWWILALVVSVMGPAGDLTESALKRRAGVKDSGTLLPGHGGILDRFDSHIFAAPLAAIVLRLF